MSIFSPVFIQTILRTLLILFMTIGDWLAILPYIYRTGFKKINFDQNMNKIKMNKVEKNFLHCFIHGLLTIYNYVGAFDTFIRYHILATR